MASAGCLILTCFSPNYRERIRCPPVLVSSLKSTQIQSLQKEHARRSNAAGKKSLKCSCFAPKNKTHAQGVGCAEAPGTYRAGGSPAAPPRLLALLPGPGRRGSAHSPGGLRAASPGAAAAAPERPAERRAGRAAGRPRGTPAPARAAPSPTTAPPG